MNNNKRKKKSSRILAPLIGAVLMATPFSKSYSAENSASVGVSSYHEQVYGRAGIDYLPITRNGNLSLEGEVNYSGDNNLTKAKVGLVYRQSPEGEKGLGANVFGFSSDGHTYLTAGAEAFTKNNQLFVNGYFGDFQGVEGGLVRDLFYNQDRSFSLRGKIGGYYFQGDKDFEETQGSSGVMAGLRVKIPLSENWRIIGEGNVYSSPEFTGNASGSISIQYGGLNNRRLVQNRFLIRPEGRQVSDSRDQDPGTDTRTDNGTKPGNGTTPTNGENGNGENGNGNGDNGSKPNLDFGDGGNIGNN